MDDVNNMDESMDKAERLLERGISRRDMIKASVVAGGLVWTAPLLLSGRAAADPADTCCTNGVPVTVKVASNSGANCNGTSCIDMRAAAHPTQFSSFATQCQTFLGCINNTTLGLFTVNAFSTSGGSANITIKQGITVVSVGAKSGSACRFADCPCFATTHTAGDPCPNTDINGNPIAAAPVITVKPSGTNTVIDVAGFNPLNELQITLCLSHQVTGMCH